MTHETDGDPHSQETESIATDLTRRDALIALGAAGVGAGGLGALVWDELDDEPPGRGSDDPTWRETVVAAAEALYPASVSGVESFVETYVVGRVQDRQTYLDGVQRAAGNIDEYARYWHDRPFAALDRSTRQTVFDDYGLADSAPDPEGSEREQVRYYLLNELLFAFYSSPTGGELVGLENPPGHPGGLDSYQRGPR